MSYTSYPDLLSHFFKPTSPPFTASPQYSASFTHTENFSNYKRETADIHAHFDLVYICLPRFSFPHPSLSYCT